MWKIFDDIWGFFEVYDLDGLTANVAGYMGWILSGSKTLDQFWDGRVRKRSKSIPKTWYINDSWLLMQL